MELSKSNSLWGHHQGTPFSLLARLLESDAGQVKPSRKMLGTEYGRVPRVPPAVLFSFESSLRPGAERDNLGVGRKGSLFPIKCLTISPQRKLTLWLLLSFGSPILVMELRGYLSNISMPTMEPHGATLGHWAIVGKGKRTTATRVLPVTIFTQAAGLCFAFSGGCRDLTKEK